MTRLVLVLCLLGACGGGNDSSAADSGAADAQSSQSDERLGFEILQIISASEIVVWLSTDLSLDEFDAIELPDGWAKNQPREGVADGGEFQNSPGLAPGQFTDEVHFGFEWRHVATIREIGIMLDPGGLLSGNRIEKDHSLVFRSGRSLPVIVSPDDEIYVLVSRDARRTSDDAQVPADWQKFDYLVEEELSVSLPNPTINIRATNEDSFQGPITGLDLALTSSPQALSTVRSRFAVHTNDRFELVSARRVAR